MCRRGSQEVPRRRRGGVAKRRLHRAGAITQPRSETLQAGRSRSPPRTSRRLCAPRYGSFGGGGLSASRKPSHSARFVNERTTCLRGPSSSVAPPSGQALSATKGAQSGQHRGDGAGSTPSGSIGPSLLAIGHAIVGPAGRSDRSCHRPSMPGARWPSVGSGACPCWIVREVARMQEENPILCSSTRMRARDARPRILSARFADPAGGARTSVCGGVRPRCVGRRCPPRRGQQAGCLAPVVSLAAGLEHRKERVGHRDGESAAPMRAVRGQAVRRDADKQQATICAQRSPGPGGQTGNAGIVHPVA